MSRGGSTSASSRRGLHQLALDRGDYKRDVKLSPLKNLTEALAGDLLEQSIGPAWGVYPQVALGAVLRKDGTRLSERCFSMLQGGRYDYLIVNRESQRPMLAIEIDGPTHMDEDVAERDAVKDALSVSGQLPVCRLPLEAVNRSSDNTTLVQWVGEQFVERQRTRATHRREAKRRLADVSDDVLDALVAVDGSVEEVERGIEQALWLEHICGQNAFTAVSATATRLLTKYGIAPAGVAALLCGRVPPSDTATCLWLLLDLSDPTVAGFYVLDRDRVPVVEQDGRLVVDWQEADYRTPRYQAQSRLFADRGLELWTERPYHDTAEAVAWDATAADEWEKLRTRTFVYHAPDEFLSDRRLLSEMNDRLLERVVGFRQSHIVTNLAVYDALRKVENWAKNSLIEII